MAGILVTSLARASVAPTPPNVIRLRLDVRNLLSPSGREALPKSRVRKLIGQVNQVYSQCGVEFIPRKIVSIQAARLGVPFPPQNEQQMAQIGDKLNPHGFSRTKDAFPVTFAGSFNFFSPAFGVYLYGLTWSWVKGPGEVDRLHSMIARHHLDAPGSVGLVSHELGHFFWLDHDSGDSIMGKGLKIRAEQCEKIRTVATKYFPGMIDSGGG